MINLYQGDCLTLMHLITAQSVNLVLCDLPYGTTQNKWDSVIPFEPLWAHYKRICKGVIVLTAAQPFTSALVMSTGRSFIGIEQDTNYFEIAKQRIEAAR